MAPVIDTEFARIDHATSATIQAGIATVAEP
jgi:hypothetical protein